MVGDQPGTDGLLAERLGIPFVLVDSGVTPPGAPVDDCPVALRAADLVTAGGRTSADRRCDPDGSNCMQSACYWLTVQVG